MKKIVNELDRRSLLRYMGNAAVAAPFLRTLFETEVFGANTAKRAVFFWFPSGIVHKYWHPSATGANFDFPLSLEPLKGLKNDLALVKGVNYDCGHHHNPGTRYCFTGSNAGPSVDTILGDRLKSNVKFPNVRLGTFTQLRSGYDSAVSWTQAGTPAPVEDNPKKAFQALFGSPALNLAETDPNKAERSVLDNCIADIHSLQKKLGSIEKVKLDSHLSALRELERRINLPSGGGDPMNPGSGGGASCTKMVDFNGLEFPNERPETVFYGDANFHRIVSLQNEIAVQALACGMTNVVLVQVMHSIEDIFAMNFPGGPGIPIAQHTASHHDGNPERMLEFAKMQAYFMAQFASLISKMKAVTEGDKTLLYNSVCLAASEIGDPAFHQMENVGIVIAGQGAGAIKTNQSLDAGGAVMGDLLSTMMQSLGVAGGPGKPIAGLLA